MSPVRNRERCKPSLSNRNHRGLDSSFPAPRDDICHSLDLNCRVVRQAAGGVKPGRLLPGGLNDKTTCTRLRNYGYYCVLTAPVLPSAPTWEPIDNQNGYVFNRVQKVFVLIDSVTVFMK